MIDVDQLRMPALFRGIVLSGTRSAALDAICPEVGPGHPLSCVAAHTQAKSAQQCLVLPGCAADAHILAMQRTRRGNAESRREPRCAGSLPCAVRVVRLDSYVALANSDPCRSMRRCLPIR